MWNKQHVLCFISVCVAVSCNVVFRDVATDKGVVRGYNSDVDNVISYYGIPYAAATTGDNRFKGPQPRSPWNGVFEATEKYIVCPHQLTFSDTFLQLNRSLDCLRLNIFTPNTNETDLPVMVYIHGGGFQTSYGMVYDPIPLVQRGIVAVNFNYRLGVQGFLCLGTSFAPGNAGLKDQNAALRWVKTNIVKFGGDPHNIIIAGSSAGSMSAEFQYISPLSKGLFSKVILESGSMLSTSIIDTDPFVPAELFVKTFGNKEVQRNDLEKYYRYLDDKLLSAETNIRFQPCIETHQIEGVEKFLDKHPKEILMLSEYEPKPLLTGFTSMEGLEFIEDFESTKKVIESNYVSLLPTDLNFKSEHQAEEITRYVKDFYFPGGISTKLGYIKFMTDTIFSYPQMVSARLHAKNGDAVYLFLFNYNGTVNLPSVMKSDIKGPGHVVSSLYVQNYDYKPIYENMTSNDRLVQEKLRQMWINFMVHGNPTPMQSDLHIVWPAMTPHEDTFLNIDVPMSAGTDPLSDRFRLWDRVYELTAADKQIK